MTPRTRWLSTAALIALVLAPEARAQAGRRTTVLDPNTAGEQELAALPGMTPALVKVVTGRRPFLGQSALDSALAPSLDGKARAALYGRLFVQLDLNTAPDAEILMIPGVGPRMLREFKEYRPYTALAQFRRETPADALPCFIAGAVRERVAEKHDLQLLRIGRGGCGERKRERDCERCGAGSRSHRAKQNEPGPENICRNAAPNRPLREVALRYPELLAATRSDGKRAPLVGRRGR